MGKWVVCPQHPSNKFFEQFPNCLTYINEGKSFLFVFRSKDILTTHSLVYFNTEELAANVYWALNHDPHPLTSEQRYELSWDAATERFLEASTITKDMQQKSKAFTDKFIGWLLELVGSGNHGDIVRLLAGGRGASNQVEHMNKYGSARPVFTDDEESIPETATTPGHKFVDTAVDTVAKKTIDAETYEEGKQEEVATDGSSQIHNSAESENESECEKE